MNLIQELAGCAAPAFLISVGPHLFPCPRHGSRAGFKLCGLRTCRPPISFGARAVTAQGGGRLGLGFASLASLSAKTSFVEWARVARWSRRHRAPSDGQAALLLSRLGCMCGSSGDSILLLTLKTMVSCAAGDYGKWNFGGKCVLKYRSGNCMQGLMPQAQPCRLGCFHCDV